MKDSLKTAENLIQINSLDFRSKIRLSRENFEPYELSNRGTTLSSSGFHVEVQY